MTYNSNNAGKIYHRLKNFTSNICTQQVRDIVSCTCLWKGPSLKDTITNNYLYYFIFSSQIKKKNSTCYSSSCFFFFVSHLNYKNFSFPSNDNKSFTRSIAESLVTDRKINGVLGHLYHEFQRIDSKNFREITHKYFKREPLLQKNGSRMEITS